MKKIMHQPFGEDNNHLKSFVETVFSKHKDLEQNFLTSMGNTSNKGIYSLNDENGIVVLATTHHSTWHPHCVYVRLAYDLTQVDDEAIKLLIDDLKEEFAKPLFFLIDDRFKGLDELLLDRGLRFIRKTEVITFLPQKREMLNIDRKVKAISEITNEPILMTSLIELCKKIYTETHLDNPVDDFSLAKWESIIMEDLNEENSYVVIGGNKVIAFSLMHQGEENHWELGWIGVENRSEIYLLDLLITMQLRDATNLGVVEIEKEVDSTCPYSQHIVESLTYNISETLYAFIS